MNQPTNYLAVREAHQLVTDLWHELPSGTYPDDLQASLTNYLTEFDETCRAGQPTNYQWLGLAQQRAKAIYLVHFWQMAHTYWDSMQQRARIERALLSISCAPFRVICMNRDYDRLRIEAAINANINLN